MKIDRRQMKREARFAMKHHQPSVYAVALVYLLIALALSLLSLKLQNPGLTLPEIFRQYTDLAMSAQQLDTGALFSGVTQRPSGADFVGNLLDLALTMMSLVIDAGFVLFCLHVSRGVAAGFSTLFDGFGLFLKIIWLNVVMDIFIFLWSLLFVLPGVVASYRYSFALYLLLDDPQKSVLQCIRESKRLTYGCKWQLFTLDLSFLGWALLCVFPPLLLFVAPYLQITHANYYRRVTERGA